ncbi:MAG: hypothetical protein M3Y41_09195 [Pseudomonadota bacterium]|nr:hypothetical protein [Pseudomonadota bacterium]
MNQKLTSDPPKRPFSNPAVAIGARDDQISMLLVSNRCEDLGSGPRHVTYDVIASHLVSFEPCSHIVDRPLGMFEVGGHLHKNNSISVM